MRATLLTLLVFLPPICAVRPARAADPPGAELTLPAAVEAALERYPSVALARAGERAAEAAIDEAEASRLPRAAIGGRAIQYQEPVPVTPFHGFSVGSFPEFDDLLVQADLSLRYSLYSGGARSARIGRAQALAGAAGARTDATRDEIVARTVAAYLRVLGLADVLGAHDRRLEALEAERSRVEQLFAVGRAAEVERQRIAAALAAARAEHVRLEADLATAEEDLARLIGVPDRSIRAAGLAPVVLAAAEPPSREQLADLLLDTSPELARARQELLAAEQDVALARSAWRPDLALESRYQELSGADLAFSDEWSVALQVGITLFEGGARGARLARTGAQRDAAAERLRLLETELLGRLDRALAELAQTTARVASLETAAESFAEVARVEMLRLETGTGIQAEFLDAEAELLGARAALSEARYGRAVAATEVARVTGTLDPGWVDDNLVEATP